MVAPGPFRPDHAADHPDGHATAAIGRVDAVRAAAAWAGQPDSFGRAPAVVRAPIDRFEQFTLHSAEQRIAVQRRLEVVPRNGQKTRKSDATPEPGSNV